MLPPIRVISAEKARDAVKSNFLNLNSFFSYLLLCGDPAQLEILAYKVMNSYHSSISKEHRCIIAWHIIVKSALRN
jgi:hypothetical protein